MAEVSAVLLSILRHFQCIVVIVTFTSPLVRLSERIDLSILERLTKEVDSCPEVEESNGILKSTQKGVNQRPKYLTSTETKT